MVRILRADAARHGSGHRVIVAAALLAALVVTAAGQRLVSSGASEASAATRALASLYSFGDVYGGGYADSQTSVTVKEIKVTFFRPPAATTTTAVPPTTTTTLTNQATPAQGIAGKPQGENSSPPFTSVWMYPNPFYPGADGYLVQKGTGKQVSLRFTSFCFTVNVPGHVFVSFFDSKGFLGRMYARPYFSNGRMFNRYLSPGRHYIGWTGTLNGKLLLPGTYKYVLTANNGKLARTYQGTVTLGAP